MKLKFSVLGEPAGKGRPRFRNAGAFVQTYTPEKTVSYENLVRLEYRRQCNDFKFPKDTPLDVRITAYYGIPKSVSKKKAQLMRAENQTDEEARLRQHRQNRVRLPERHRLSR